MYLNGRSTSVRDRLLCLPLEDMAVCSIIKAELCVDLLFALVMQSILKDLM
jgi:hypothetical protein